MGKKVSDKKVKISYGRAKWFSISAISFILLYIAISFINDADYFADNIKFLLDDPYIYWIGGWILFSIAILIFPFACVKFILGCVQYYNSNDFKKIKAQVEAEE